MTIPTSPTQEDALTLLHTLLTVEKRMMSFDGFREMNCNTEVDPIWRSNREVRKPQTPGKRLLD